MITTRPPFCEARLPQADLRFYLRAETAPWAHPHRFGSSFKGRTSDSHRRLRVFVAVVCERHPGCASTCLRCARPLLLRLQVALVCVPFDLDLLALCAFVRNVAACLAITHGSVLRGLDLLECAESRGAPRNPPAPTAALANSTIGPGAPRKTLARTAPPVFIKTKRRQHRTIAQLLRKCRLDPCSAPPHSSRPRSRPPWPTRCFKEAKKPSQH